ncbi:hypothetical protein F7725_009303 [Dissostichus mawsoni]|uniref:Uncharacterized protein n=1 Tax=Dissostichus mawsoni TaxID=36200 RepID=A0A7J5Z6N3_DISMA|nr:hypothetical protein F7725_009303 [Dissostichus mawsoni]
MIQREEEREQKNNSRGRESVHSVIIPKEVLELIEQKGIICDETSSLELEEDTAALKDICRGIFVLTSCPVGRQNDNIGPLDDDDADKEGGVAGEFHDLPLLVSLKGNTQKTHLTSCARQHYYLLLIVQIFIIPVHSDAQQGGGQEAIFSQDHKVCEETSKRLDHTCRKEKGRSHIFKLILNIPNLHYIIGNHHFSSTLVHIHHVSSQVDTEDGDGSQGQRDVGDDEKEEGGDLRDVTVTMEAKLSSSRIMSAACLETSDPEMPIATPMSAFFRAGESFTPSPVTATMAPCGQRGEKPFHNDQFLLRGGSGKHYLRVVLQDVVQLLWGQIFQTCSDVLNSLVAFGDDANTLCNGLSCDWMITSLLHFPTASGTAARGGSIMDMRPMKQRFSVGKFTSSVSKAKPSGTVVGQVELAETWKEYESKSSLGQNAQ